MSHERYRHPGVIRGTRLAQKIYLASFKHYTKDSIMVPDSFLKEQASARGEPRGMGATSAI
jgi:hypothetical protein